DSAWEFNFKTRSPRANWRHSTAGWKRQLALLTDTVCPSAALAIPSGSLHARFGRHQTASIHSNIFGSPGHQFRSGGPLSSARFRISQRVLAEFASYALQASQAATHGWRNAVCTHEQSFSRGAKGMGRRGCFLCRELRRKRSSVQLGNDPDQKPTRGL